MNTTAKAGYRFESASISDSLPVYDALMDFLAMFRSMDRQAALEFSKIVQSRRLSQHGPVGMAIADVLMDFSPTGGD